MREFMKRCKVCGEEHSIIKGDFTLCDTCSYLKTQLAVAKQKVVYFRSKLANAENKVAKINIELDNQSKKNDN